VRKDIGKLEAFGKVGLNLMVANAFGYCYASCARVESVSVIASLSNVDSLTRGESTYVSELRRAHEMISATGARPYFYLIDEIFRGTNHLESMAASAAVLRHLSEKGIVIASSHNIGLGKILAGELTALCLNDCGTHKTLALKRGILDEPNGIALLNEAGFSTEIQESANQILRSLTQDMLA
jgi:DNA mismatch repair ATPase MutS